MSHIEKMKQWLEALEHAAQCVQNNYCPDNMGHDWDEQIESLRQAITTEESSAVQEPDKYLMDIECTKCGAKQSGILTVHPKPKADHIPDAAKMVEPKREWVGLTDREMQDIWDRYAHMEMMRTIEAKLKEKNT